MRRMEGKKKKRTINIFDFLFFYNTRISISKGEKGKRNASIAQNWFFSLFDLSDVIAEEKKVQRRTW